MIAPLVWCGCETWSLRLKEEHTEYIWEHGDEENISTQDG